MLAANQLEEARGICRLAPVHAQKSAGVTAALLERRDGNGGGVARDGHARADNGFDLVVHLLFDVEIFEDAFDHEFAGSEIGERGRGDVPLGQVAASHAGKPDRSISSAMALPM